MFEAFFQYSFLQNAFISGILIGLIAPFIGVFLIVRRQSLIADALSHITLSGVAAGLLLSQRVPLFSDWNPIYFGTAFSVGGAFVMDKLRQVYRYYQELAIPIILSTGIALGVVLLSLANGFNVDLFGYLFGSLLSVTDGDLIRVVLISLIVFAVVFLFYKELLFLSFDEEGARLSGVSRRLVNVTFSVLVALVISVSMQVVGILLVSALITLPVATALQLASSFRQTFIYSVLFGEVSVISGLIIAYQFNMASGGTIVLVAVVLLLLVLFVKKVKRI